MTRRGYREEGTKDGVSLDLERLRIWTQSSVEHLSGDLQGFCAPLHSQVGLAYGGRFPVEDHPPRKKEEGFSGRPRVSDGRGGKRCGREGGRRPRVGRLRREKTEGENRRHLNALRTDAKKEGSTMGPGLCTGRNFDNLKIGETYLGSKLT